MPACSVSRRCVPGRCRSVPLKARLRLPVLSLAIAVGLVATMPRSVIAGKPGLFESINTREAATWQAAKSIWELAEPGYQETKSSRLLASMLEAAGFELAWNIGGIPTAFTATAGSGEPVIGVLGEYDALPGL